MLCFRRKNYWGPSQGRTKCNRANETGHESSQNGSKTGRSSSNSGSILPQSNNAAPSMHPVVREVTEDTPPDLLEGTMDLLVVLPSKKTVRMTVSRRTPMMDLLVQVTTANKIAPGGHIVQVRNERGIELPYKPSTPIGALDTTTIEIVPKNQVNEYIIVKKQTAKIANQPFEQTFRLQVHLPRNQLYVMRVGPKTQLEEILKEVCREKNLDCSKYEIRHPVKLDERLPLDGRIGDFELQELNVVSRNSRINSSVSTADIMALQGDEALSKGCLIDSAFKHSRSSVGDSSVSSESAASARGISPSRSDDSRSISPLPPLRPKMKLNTTVSNASSSSGTSSTVPRIIQQQPLQLNKSPVEPPPRTKKRAAPQPPTLSSSSNIRESQSEGLNRIIESKPPAPIKPTPRKKEPPKDPPGWSNNKTTALPIHHSRHSSDSSGYHEACEPHHHEIHRLDRQQSVPTINVSAALAVQQRVTSSVSVSNLTTVPSISTTSLASSNGGVRKRKAPKPPSAPVIPKEIIAEESPTVSEEHPAPPPPVANNNTKRISESAPSLTREETLVDEVETKVVPATVLEEPVKAITVDLTADDKSVVLEESSLSESLAESSYTASEVSTGTSSATTTSSSSPVPTSPEEISTPRVPSSQEIRTETPSKRSSSLPDDNISVVMDSRSTLGPVVPGTEDASSSTAVPTPRKPRTRPTSMVESEETWVGKPKPKPRPRPTPPANIDLGSELSTTTTTTPTTSSIASIQKRPASSGDILSTSPSSYQPNRFGIKVLPDDAFLDARFARLSRQNVLEELHDDNSPPRPSRKKYRAPVPSVESPSSASTVLAPPNLTHGNDNNDNNVQARRDQSSQDLNSGESGAENSSRLTEDDDGRGLVRKPVVTRKKRTAPVPNSLKTDNSNDTRPLLNGAITSPEGDMTPDDPGSFDFTRTSSDRHLVNKSNLFGKNNNQNQQGKGLGSSKKSLNRWQNFESLNDVQHLTSNTTGTKRKNSSDDKHPLVLLDASKSTRRLTTTSSDDDDDYKGDEAQDDVEVTQGGSSESEGSFSDSGVRVSEETATPSPDAAILGQLEKESESLQSSRRSSLEHEPEDEATLRELLQAKLENEHEIIDKAFEGIELGDEDQAKSPVDGGANPNFDLAPSPAMTKALESMTPSPMPVTDHTSDDDRALTPSSEEEPVEEPEGLFIPERKISKSESFSHNSEFDSARKRRIFSKDGSKATLKNTYMSSSEEDLSERMSNNRAESMQNLSRNSNNNNNNSNASQEKTDEDRPTVVRKRSANRPPRSESFRKTASVINMQDIDPAIAQNPELMATFQSELEAQFEQLKAKFLQKYGQLPNPDTVDSKQQEKQVTASNNESPLERSESPVTNVKQVLETEAQVHAEVPGKSALEVLNSSTSVQEQSVAIVQETTTVQEVNVAVQEIVPVAQEELQTQANEPVEVSELAEPVKPELVNEVSQTVKEAVTEPPKPPTPEPVVQAEVPEEIQVPVKVEEPAPIQDSETVQVPEPIQHCETVQAVEHIQEAVPLEIKPAIEEVQKVEAAVEILATAIVNNIPDQQEEPEKVEEMPITQKEEPVQEVEKEEEEPQRIYKYSGPPTIKMATWGERPQRSVSVKRDNDYIMGFGQHGSVAAKVNTYSDANSKPPLPRPAVTPAVTPSVPSKPVVELRTAATLPSVLSNWKQKMEQNRKSAPPTTVASVEIETAKDNVPAASTLERVKKSFTEHSSSPPPLSRVNGDVRRPKNVDDTDAASDYSSSSSSRPNSSLSRVPSNASISNATVSDSTSSSPVPPTASLSERRRLFQIKPMESSKEKPIPAQNLRGNIATIQRVFEQQQQQQQQQQQAQSQQSSLKSSRAGSISSTTSSIDSSPAPSISIRSNSPVSSVAVMQKVLRGNSVNLDEFRRTPSPSASSMSSTSLRSSEHSRQASPLPSTEVASTNRIVIESKPRDSVIRNAQNRSIIIVSNEDVVDSNPYKQKLRVTAAAPELKRAEPAKVEIVQGGGQLRRTPSTPIIISAAAPNIEIPVGTGKVSSIAAELKSSNNGFFSSLGRQAKDSSVNRQPTSKPIIIDGVEKPRKVSAVAAPEVVSGPAKNVVTKKDTGSVPPPPPPPSNMQFNGGLQNNNNNSRPKSLNMSQQAAKSSSNTPTSPSDPRSEILDAIKNSNGKFGLKKTGSAILLR